MAQEDEDILDGLDEALGEMELQMPTVDRDALTKHSLVTLSEPEGKALRALLDSLLVEGNGEAVYTIGTAVEQEAPGLAEEELAQARDNLEKLCSKLNAEVSEVRRRHEEQGWVQEVLIRRRCEGADFIEVRVAVVGNVDAGKSTLLGVLTHDVLDNGRGRSRQKLFRHQHEIDSGRTSSVAHDILGFDARGQVVNRPGHDGKIDWVQVCTDAAKVVTFIDLAGHERYLKTTVFGLTGHVPHFAMLMIGSNAGIVGMTKGFVSLTKQRWIRVEHLGLALALNVPVYVVVTKIDMCPPNVLDATLKLLQKILKSPGCRKIPLMVSNVDDVVVAATNFISERVCPIFQVSNVTGENLDLLKLFMNLLNSHSPKTDAAPAEFQIDDTFSVPGVGTVVSGTNLRGTVRVNDTLLLGPDSLGTFRPVVIKGIHRRRTPTKKVPRSFIRKGMVMVAPEVEPVATWEFEGELLVLHHPTTISVKYEAVVHCGSVRQTASIISMDKLHIRTGDKTTARFRFVRNPEYLREGDRLIFREGRTKAVGTVTRLFS
ncbi:uncharacterized protein MONBRDRAFT_39133 [Monosiga brevicollis MX1]|uniref:Tr-type G domain-containing protein n=1 Tax=Monosiga brevicollis TaxID=81824 RepID=A9VCG9_MONBE|nr:uncharacterized protein MONBRDRAFT_39133 [Monosiga brevicollis MX1]EDQ84748.1 predicted protein [Monosiga brevicollis MX1]|eukprot:XP_001750398.1 hypothetical protein [Monosiga brevicollis MX1]